jgi:UDP-N-acetylglucosamine--N-acetylmuramyl-(pentapeptide) pyrophosphoryl-undecaprenol N-acetylglucosamine transferase
VVVFSGGGTGGHLYPALALADALVRARPGVRCCFVGAEGGLEARILPERGLEHLLLPVRGIARGRRLAALGVAPALAASLLRVGRHFRSLRPEVVVVTGGYAGGPAGLVAGAMKIPLVLQEQNAVPGVTTRILSRWATQVHLAFPEAASYLPLAPGPRVRVSGNPVRPASSLTREAARAALELPRDGSLILVTGGSQGSAALNRAVLDAVTGVESGTLDSGGNVHLLWVTGPRSHQGIVAELGRLGSPSWVHVLPYAEDMPAAMAAADVAVSRAGAMTTAELLIHALPSVLVPLPTAAADHQTRNAAALEEAGAAVCMAEAELTGAGLWRRLLGLLRNPDLRARMRTAARGRAHPHAAGEIAGAIADLLPEEGS